MTKGLIICLLALASIASCSNDKATYFVRHAKDGQRNQVTLAPHATVNDLARAIIGLGERSGLALCLGSQSFVTADGITIQYAGQTLEPRDAPLADFGDLGVGQEAWIEYKPKVYQIRGVSDNGTAIVYNMFVGETGIFKQMMQRSLWNETLSKRRIPVAAYNSSYSRNRMPRKMWRRGPSESSQLSSPRTVTTQPKNQGTQTIEQAVQGPVLGACCVCLRNPATHAMIPCGHKCLCKNCTKVFKTQKECHQPVWGASCNQCQCPICRKAIEGILQIFD